MAVDPSSMAGDPHPRVAGTKLHELFEAHSRMVYGLCRALLRDVHDAEDATQATFVSAYRALLGGSQPREPAAWLATIARNECAGRARARMREPLPLLEAEIAHTQGPEAELERRASVAELRQAIADLPEKQREAVVLRDLYGLHYTEVGAALGMSVASVESLLFRARRRLRASLKPLATGALTVPVAVQEGVAQAIPTFAAAGAAGGGATTGAVGLGLLAKVLAGPAGVKVAAGVAAAVTAGSIAVAGIERADRGAPAVEPAAEQAPAPAEALGPDGGTTASFTGNASSPSSGGGSADDRPVDDRSGRSRGGDDRSSADRSDRAHEESGTAAAGSSSGETSSGTERSGRDAGTSGPSAKDGAPGGEHGDDGARGSGASRGGGSGTSGGKGGDDGAAGTGASGSVRGDDTFTIASGEDGASGSGSGDASDAGGADDTSDSGESGPGSSSGEASSDGSGDSSSGGSGHDGGSDDGADDHDGSAATGTPA